LINRSKASSFRAPLSLPSADTAVCINQLISARTDES
jgi:hypothetical protein